MSPDQKGSTWEPTASQLVYPDVETSETLEHDQIPLLKDARYCVRP